MSEKQFFTNKKATATKNICQKIENKFSGFPDLIIINEMLPLFIELKAPTKGNKFKVELSQISTHLRIKANNYVSFFLVRHPQTKALYLFEGGKLCTFLASHTLATLLVSEASEGFLGRGRWKLSWHLRIKKLVLCRKENEMVALRFLATFTNRTPRLQMRLLLRHESCNGNGMVASAIRCIFAPLPLDKTRKVEGGKKNDPTPRGVRSSPFFYMYL